MDRNKNYQYIHYIEHVICHSTQLDNGCTPERHEISVKLVAYILTLQCTEHEHWLEVTTFAL